MSIFFVEEVRYRVIVEYAAVIQCYIDIKIFTYYLFKTRKNEKNSIVISIFMYDD